MNINVLLQYCRISTQYRETKYRDTSLSLYFLWSLTCSSSDPDVPQDLNVSSWNSSSVSLTWGHENSRLSLFLLTIFYLNGTDQVTEEVCFWLKDHASSFTWSDVQPCTRVRFGLQSVCQSGVESRYSDMVMNDGNSGKKTV